MTVDNLIMISAMYENGGNTTHRLLDGHPGLFVYPFESQVGTGLTNDFLSSYVPIRYRWPEFSMDGSPSDDYEAFWDEELKTYLRTPYRSKFRDCGIIMDEKKRKERFIQIADSLPRSRASLVRAFFQSTFETWENLNKSGNEKYYVGYNPAQILDAEKIIHDFPNGHIIHVVRNPYSGYADQFRRPFPPSLNRYAHTWSYCQILAMTYKAKYPDNVHIVRFEDLLINRQQILTNLFARLGLEMNDICLSPSFNGKVLEKIAPWGTIRTATVEENIATASELSLSQKQEVWAITRIAQNLMGYTNFLKTGDLEPINDSNSTGPF